jgi:phage recombination protein Bet
MQVDKQLTPAKRSKAAAAAEHAELSPEQLKLIKDTVARGATDAELQLFLHLSTRYDLDPFAKEIWCLKYASNQPATIFTSRDGYLKIANNDAAMNGLVSDVVYQHDELQKLADGSVVHVYGRPDRGAITGAYALVYRKDRSYPTYFYAPLSEYGGGNNPTWKKYPSAMIVKVAEAMALKRAFSISGLVTKEELGLEPDIEQGPEAETSAVVVTAEVPKKAPAEAVAPVSAPLAVSVTSAPSAANEAEAESVRRRIEQQIANRHITPGERERMTKAIHKLNLAQLLEQSAKIAECVEYRPSPQAVKEARGLLVAFAEAHAIALGEPLYKFLIDRSTALTVTAVDLLTEIEQAKAELGEGKVAA